MVITRCRCGAEIILDAETEDRRAFLERALAWHNTHAEHTGSPTFATIKEWFEYVARLPE